MRLWRLLKRKLIISVLLVAGLIFTVSQVLLERRRVSLTKEILSALGSRDTSEQVNVHVNTTIINSGLCKPWGTRTNLLAAVIVISKPDEVEERQQMREHWRRWVGNYKDVQLIFFVGLPADNNFRPLQTESIYYDDIVVESMKESYYALTLKTLRMLKWFVSTCSNVKFLVKADIDIFIHLPNLVNYLNSVDKQGPSVSDNFIGGDVATDALPIHDPSNKWYMPPELLEGVDLKIGAPYPDYTLGGFYVVSGALVPALLSRSLTVRLIQFEDVFLTGFVAHRDLGINLTKIPHVYSNYKQYIIRLFITFYEDSLIASHLQGDNAMMVEYFRHHQAQHAESLKN